MAIDPIRNVLSSGMVLCLRGGHNEILRVRFVSPCRMGTADPIVSAGPRLMAKRKPAPRKASAARTPARTAVDPKKEIAALKRELSEVAPAAGRDRRRAQGHQPLDV